VIVYPDPTLMLATQYRQQQSNNATTDRTLLIQRQLELLFKGHHDLHLRQVDVTSWPEAHHGVTCSTA
jgi:hypothetical protein